MISSPSFRTWLAHSARGTIFLFTATAIPLSGIFSSETRLVMFSERHSFSVLFIFSFILLEIRKREADGQKKYAYLFQGYAIRFNIHNSYGSTDCIRFEGMISAYPGTPLLTQANIYKVRNKGKIYFDFLHSCTTSFGKLFVPLHLKSLVGLFVWQTGNLDLYGTGVSLGIYYLE